MVEEVSGYDYIIVGSGTAGATLAARLTEDPSCRVLVLEVGGPDRNFLLKVPVGYYKAIYNAKVSHLYRSEPEPGLGGRQMDCPRGRVLGGSSSINGLIYIRGQHDDFDDWAKLGADGWDYNAVLPAPQEALAICNDVEFGLSACLDSEQTPLVEHFLSEAESGMLHVNCGNFPEDHAPFVGVKNSSLGVGGSNGPSTLHFYTQEHTVFRKGQA